MLKLVAINSSPRMEKGNTALILTPFLDGAAEAGAEVESFYTKKLNINPCRVEYSCWFKTPGACIQHDDMEILLPLVSAADILILATPVYVDGMTGPMKNMLDRFIAIGQPIVELREGHCRHPGRVRLKNGRLGLVSSCGFWELDNFEPLVMHMQAIARNLGREFCGALLRPHGPALKEMVKRGAPVSDIFEAAKEAGRQIVRNGRMQEDVLRVIGRELLPQKEYVDIINQRAKEILDRLETD